MINSKSDRNRRISWASATASARAPIFEALHSGLTVQMIMTPRPDLTVCRPDQTLKSVKQRNTGRYSYLPVVGAAGRIEGLLCAEQWFDTPAPARTVREHFEPLSESNLIGADASILEFVRQADERPCCLVVAGHQIEGLVSLSDLQRLPVRAALFALVTGLELTMADAIRARHQTSDEWRVHLSDGRWTRVQREIENSKKADGYIDDLLFTQFSDKADIIRKSFDLCVSRESMKRDFRAICSLRDNLAHANDFAQSPDAARKVSATVRRAFKLQADLAPLLQTAGKY